MDLQGIFDMLSGLHPAVPLVLAGLGALVVLGQAYVMVSPSKNDDAWLAKIESMAVVGAILKGLKAFAPIQKKDK